MSVQVEKQEKNMAKLRRLTIKIRTALTFRDSAEARPPR